MVIQLSAMREQLSREKLLEFLTKLGSGATSKGNCYLTGGATAVLIGWRETTVDVDLKFDPEPEGVFEVIPQLKTDLKVNVELASPDDFIPEMQGWRERSKSIGQFDKVAVFHYDFISQALAKLERGHGKDLDDVKQMLARGLISKEGLARGIEEIRPRLKRYPAIDEAQFIEKVNKFLAENQA
jgi:hypothetical protein